MLAKESSRESSELNHKLLLELFFRIFTIAILGIMQIDRTHHPKGLKQAKPKDSRLHFISQPIR